ADVAPAPAKEAQPEDDSCLRWAAHREAADGAAVQRSFIIQPVLVWDPDAGEWVRLLLIWDRTPGDDPGNKNRDAEPEPAMALPQPRPEIDLTEPGVIVQELPRWEQLFDRWEKTFAERQRRHLCTPAAAL